MWNSVDQHPLYTKKGLNSKFLSIMLIFNKMWFLGVLFKVMVVLRWLGSTSHRSIYTGRHNVACVDG